MITKPKPLSMKNQSLCFPVFLFASVLIAYGCTSEPPAVATSADGVEIVFHNQGKGDASILLVHGWTNNNTIWDLQVPVLAEKYQVVALDLAGHGKSGNNRAEWTMSAFGEDIAAVLETAKLENVILVGFSMGGPAILEAAKLLPVQVKGLILIDAINNPEAQYPPPVIHWVDSTFMDLVANPTPEKLIAYGFFENIPEGAMGKLHAMFDRDQTGWRDMLLENIRWSNEDCIGTLEALDIPLLAINTAHVPTELATFQKYVPSFEATILSGTGHVMMWEVTEDFNQALEKSIQKILAATL